MPLDKLDPNVTADLLKLYLLELPEPLVPYDCYNKLLGSRNEGTRSAPHPPDDPRFRYPRRRPQEAGGGVPARQLGAAYT